MEANKYFKIAKFLINKLISMASETKQSSKAEASDISNEESSEESSQEFAYTRKKKVHGLKNKPSNNRRRKEDRNIKWKTKYAPIYVEKLIESSNRSLNDRYWLQEISNCITGATFERKTHGTYDKWGMKNFKIIYI